MVAPRDVAVYRQSAPAGVFDHARRFLVALFRTVRHYDTDALSRERQRGCATDAFAAPVTKAALPAKLP